MKFVSSIRVTSTAVVTPFLVNVAAVVAPTARSALVKFLPATMSAFASAGGAVGEGVGVGVAVALAVEDGDGVGVALAVGEAVGVAEGVALATGFAGAFLTGAFFTGFLTTFLTGGFFAARARSPMKKAERVPAIKEMNFLRPELRELLAMVSRSVPSDCFVPKCGYTLDFRQLHRKRRRGESIRYMLIQRSYRSL